MSPPKNCRVCTDTITHHGLHGMYERKESHLKHFESPASGRDGRSAHTASLIQARSGVGGSEAARYSPRSFGMHSLRATTRGTLLRENKWTAGISRLTTEYLMKSRETDFLTSPTSKTLCSWMHRVSGQSLGHVNTATTGRKDGRWRCAVPASGHLPKVTRTSRANKSAAWKSSGVALRWRYSRGSACAQSKRTSPWRLS